MRVNKLKTRENKRTGRKWQAGADNAMLAVRKNLQRNIHN